MKKQILKKDLKVTPAKKLKGEELTPREKNIKALRLWLKALLIAEPCIPNIIKIVDSLIENKASFYGSYNTLKDNTFQNMEKIIDYTERKKSLVNVYIIAKEITRTLNLKEMEIVVFRYHKRLKAERIGEILGCSGRYIYKKSEQIIEKLVKRCLESSWSADYLAKLLENEPWIEVIFKQLERRAGHENIRVETRKQIKERKKLRS